jgi:hypothetical protein
MGRWFTQGQRDAKVYAGRLWIAVKWRALRPRQIVAVEVTAEVTLNYGTGGVSSADPV